MTRVSWLTYGLLGLLVPPLIGGCGGKGDPDVERRREWLARRTEAEKAYLQAVLNGTDDIQFYDGWYNLEHDPKTHGAWRWMGRRGIVRLRTKLGGVPTAQDMELHVFGWVPHEHAPLRQLQMELAINGQVLERFDPPPAAFEHVLLVPKQLLEHSEWVDFAITVANAPRPPGDGRELGFSTTGFHWKPAAARPAP
jgi:hypothetical protein